MKNRLMGDAAVYKQMLDRDKLKAKDGPDYLLRELRPHFVKGKQNTYLYRLLQWFRLRRGRLDFHRWIAKYQLVCKRMMDAWMDLYEPVNQASPEYTGDLDSLRRVHERQGTDMPLEIVEILAQINEARRERETREFFPVSTERVCSNFSCTE